MSVSAVMTGSALRECLEAAFCDGRLEEALRLSALVDEMQLELFRKELACKRPAV
ncbi:MAG: hypothetical protein IJ461_01920 [Clostridia bacterium]|nr:hypothetical protein [Clostridia bacterium]